MDEEAKPNYPGCKGCKNLSNAIEKGYCDKAGELCELPPSNGPSWESFDEFVKKEIKEKKEK